MKSNRIMPFILSLLFILAGCGKGFNTNKSEFQRSDIFSKSSVSLFEAESMTADGRLVQSGNHAFLYKPSGVKTTIPNMSSGKYELIVYAKQQQAGSENAKISVRIDDKEVAQVDVDATDTFKAYAISLDLSAGSHVLGLHFINDYRNKNEDRNLLIDKVSIEYIPPALQMVEMTFPSHEMTEDGVMSRPSDYIFMYINAGLLQDINIDQAGSYNLDIYALQSKAGREDAQLDVLINGEKVNTIAVSNTDLFKPYQLTVNLPKGLSQLGLYFINDFNDKVKGEDRNLSIQKAVLRGPVQVLADETQSEPNVPTQNPPTVEMEEEPVESYFSANEMDQDGPMATKSSHVFMYTDSGLIQGLEILKAGTYDIEVQARQTQAGSEAAQLEVSLNGVIKKVFSVTNTEKFEPFQISVDLQKGTANLGLYFTNDFNDPVKGEDRNLLVQSATFSGPASVGPAQVLTDNQESGGSNAPEENTAVETCTPAIPSGLKEVVLNPGQSIQNAIKNAQPGTIIKLRAGTYYEAVTISGRRDFTASKPLVITSADGPRTATIRPPNGVNNKSAIYIITSNHITIDGLSLVGTADSSTDDGVLKFIGGNGKTTWSTMTGNISVYNSSLTGRGRDCIKVGRANTMKIIGNTINCNAGDAHIDAVTVRNFEISYNDIKGNSKNGITMKSASSNSHIHHNLFNGTNFSPSIKVGGLGFSQVNREAPSTDSWGYEARNIQVDHNVIYSRGSAAIWYRGAQFSTVEDNYINGMTGSSQYSSKQAPSGLWLNQTGNLPPYNSYRNVFKNNTFDGNLTSPYIESGQGANDQVSGNNFGSISDVTYKYGVNGCK